jgi:hypothetical protein
MGIKIVPKKKDKKAKAGYAQGGNVQAKQKRYAQGGTVSAGSPRLKPSNSATTKARGMGAATRGGNFKV